MKEVVTYLNFEGKTRDAMNFYAKGLGAELELISFADHMGANLPKEMEANKDGIMHARLSKGGKTLLMASDAMPGTPLPSATNFSVSVHCESAEEIEKVFVAMAEGANIRMPLQDASWGARFGMLTDKFGIQWMFNYEHPKKS